MKLTMTDTLLTRGRKVLDPLSRSRNLPRLAAIPPDSAYGEAFRLLSLNVTVLLAERANKGIVVMSAYPGEGRSSVVANLALALAQETKVLLVDGYNERAILRSVFEKSSPQTGVRPEAMPAQTSPTNCANLWLLNGAAPALGSLGRLSAAVRTASEAGIITVVDTPPAAISSAAFSLAREVGQAVYIINSRKQDIGIHRGIREQLRRLDVEILGLVVNER